MHVGRPGGNEDNAQQWRKATCHNCRCQQEEVRSLRIAKQVTASVAGEDQLPVTQPFMPCCSSNHNDVQLSAGHGCQLLVAILPSTMTACKSIAVYSCVSCDSSSMRLLHDGRQSCMLCLSAACPKVHPIIESTSLKPRNRWSMAFLLMLRSRNVCVGAVGCILQQLWAMQSARVCCAMLEQILTLVISKV